MTIFGIEQGTLLPERFSMRAPNGKRLYIQEVAPRDGLQIEPIFVPTSDKITLIDALGFTGVAKIEVTSFTSPKAIPTLADAEQVMQGIRRNVAVEYSVLVPNLKGAQRALASCADELNVVMSASESHNLANLRMSCDDSVRQISDVVSFVGSQLRLNASISTSFGCPFEGEVLPERVIELVARLVDIGLSRISICDTTGMAYPTQVESLFVRLRQRWPSIQFTAHFHDTRGMGLANVIAALDTGVTHFDAALGGIGGCPYAPGASGNICTEDLVHMLELMGYDTGVDLDALIACARQLHALVRHDLPGQLIKAGPVQRTRERECDAVRTC